MKFIEIFLKKYEIYILAFLIILAGIFYFYHVGDKPFTDFDEATYADVIMDTLQSGNVLTLYKSGQPWFEKPPLYFWVGMLSVKVFGENEFAMRLPSILFSLITLLFTYLIVRKLSGDVFSSIIAFLILLFSPLFFYFSREVRLDSGVVMSIMISLYLIIAGWDKKSFLLLAFPFIAIGFLFKSVISFFSIPIIFIFCLIYKKWDWIKSKYLWFGFLISLCLLLPWHILQSMKFGQSFWNDYIGYHVITRGFEGIGGTGKIEGARFDYLLSLWNYSQPIIFIFLILLVIFSIKAYLSHKKIDKYILTSLFSSVFLFISFSFFKTHIITYLLPIFPFLAISISGMLNDISSSKKEGIKIALYIVLILLFIREYNNFEQYTTFPYHIEQKEAAKIYSEKSRGLSSLYVLQWPVHEAIRYYSNGNPSFINFSKDKDIDLQGPFFLLLNNAYIPYFRDSSGEILPEYKNMDVHFDGKYMMLLYSESSIILYKKDVGNEIYLVE